MITVPQLPVQTYKLFDLDAYTTYIVRVRAANRDHNRLLWGDFTNITLTTPMKGWLSYCICWLQYRCFIVNVCYNLYLSDKQIVPVNYL